MRETLNRKRRIWKTLPSENYYFEIYQFLSFLMIISVILTYAIFLSFREFGRSKQRMQWKRGKIEIMSLFNSQRFGNLTQNLSLEKHHDEFAFSTVT